MIIKRLLSIITIIIALSLLATALSNAANPTPANSFPTANATNLANMTNQVDTANSVNAANVGTVNNNFNNLGNPSNWGDAHNWEAHNWSNSANINNPNNANNYNDMNKFDNFTAATPVCDLPGNARTALAGSMPGILLEELSWLDAEKVLTPEAVIVIPLGAGSKEHGPHLPLNNDLIMAEYFKNRVLATAPVVMAPTVNYHFFPAFLAYPGSISLRLETARDLIIDICQSLARYGPRRFYLLNTGVSTIRPLRAAAESLATEGIILQFTDMIRIAAATKESLRQQEGGTHADEIETSMMLYIKPSIVKMNKAVKDYQPDKGNLTRNPQTPGTYSASGIWGDPTLATTAKGEKIVEAMVKEILQDIDRLRQTKLPQPLSPPK